jgi:hypothetical protein
MAAWVVEWPCYRLPVRLDHFLLAGKHLPAARIFTFGYHRRQAARTTGNVAHH